MFDKNGKDGMRAKNLFSEDNIRDDYKERVTYASEHMNGIVFQNEDIFHAWYLFKKIFECAKKNKYPIRIMCGHLRKEFYENLIDEAKSAIDAGCRLDVYVTSKGEESLKEEGNEFAEMMLELAEEKGAIHCKNINDDKTLPHMILAGENGEAFRYETDKVTHKALVAFGKTGFPDDLGGVLSRYFDRTLEKYFTAA